MKVGGKGRGDYFWRGDIDEVRVKLKLLQSNAHKGIDGAAEVLENFQNSRKQLILDYKKVWILILLDSLDSLTEKLDCPSVVALAIKQKGKAQA